MKKTTPKKNAMQSEEVKKKKATKKKPIKREPTEMQKRLVEKLKETREKPGKISLSKIALEAGYSKHTAKSPKDILKTPSIRRYIKKMDMDGDAAKMGHDWLFNTTQIMKLKYPSNIEQKTIIKSVYDQIPRAKLLVSFETGTGENKEIEYHFTIPDKFTVTKAVEIMYKINPPKQTVDIKSVNNIRKKKLEEVAEAMERLKLKNPIKYNTEGFQTIPSESPLTQQKNP